MTRRGDLLDNGPPDHETLILIRRETWPEAQARAIRMSGRCWRGYVTRGQAPEPASRVGWTPLWDEEQIETWVAERPGQGTRTDLAES